MREFFLATVVIVLLVTASGSPGRMLAAQSVLPDAPGRDVTVKLCGSCHAAETVASVRHTPEGWRDVIAKMVAAGAEGTEQELETVFQYLSTQFPVEAQKALNLNTATASSWKAWPVFLQEAAALIAHREKSGPCKAGGPQEDRGSRLQEDRRAEGAPRVHAGKLFLSSALLSCAVTLSATDVLMEGVDTEPRDGPRTRRPLRSRTSARQSCCGACN
jgi:hypothetical protein